MTARKAKNLWRKMTLLAMTCAVAIGAVAIGAVAIGATNVAQSKSDNRKSENCKSGNRKSGGDIVFSARFYLPAKLKDKTNRSSNYHLYRINADGSGKRQITSGAHDDELAMWSPSGSQIAFLRDDKSLILADENGRNMVKLLDVGTPDYWDGLRWSPDGKTIGFIHHAKIKDLYADVLYLVNVRTRKIERMPDVDLYAWSSDNRKMLISDSSSGLRVLDWSSRKVLELTASPGRFAWISPNKWVGTLEAARKNADDDPEGIRQIGVFDAQGKKLRLLQITKNKDGDYADWRSYVAPIPNTAQSFLFASDVSTSSGHEDIYFRASVVDGHMTRLARGESLTFAPDGKRFLLVTYHDTPPYDTLPNGHKRVVYTTKLQIGTSEKNLRDLVSGLVYVNSADWRT